MKKFLLSYLLVMVVATFAFAKSAELEIVFSMDSDMEPFITEFRLYYMDDVSQTMKLVTTMTDVAAREWQTGVVDVPPGKMTDYFISAVFVDGQENFSPSYPFALRGNPTIITLKNAADK